MKIALGITGSFCTLQKIITAIDSLVAAGYDVTPVFSYNVSSLDTRFYKAADFKKIIVDKTGKQPITSIVGAEPLGTVLGIELMLVAPCTGNTLAKIAHGITDTPVTMAVKAILRTDKPVVLSVSSNDALGANAKNIGLLLNTKNMFFVPFGQDSPSLKPHSLIADTSLILPTVAAASDCKQLQPLFFSTNKQI